MKGETSVGWGNQGGNEMSLGRLEPVQQLPNRHSLARDSRESPLEEVSPSRGGQEPL